MQTNDYHQLPASEKQIRFARSLAAKAGTILPDEVQQDRQVQFAERIARYKRSQVPDEWFRDKARMSKWIDSNK